VYLILINKITAKGNYVASYLSQNKSSSILRRTSLMKAITCSWYGSENALKASNVTIPKIGPKELLIKVNAFSVNPVDWKIRSGKIIAKTGFKPPKILGSDFAGVVVELGREISDYKVGEKVWGKVDSFKGGAYAEYIKVSLQNISCMPVGLSDEEAASIPNVALTAYQALVIKAGLKRQDRVLINGASGGVGLMAVQIAKAMDCIVTAVCSAKNVEVVKKMGANHVLDYAQEDICQSKSTYNVFFDCVANKSLLKVRKILKPSGSYVRTTPSLETALFGPICKLFGLRKAEHIMVKPSHEHLIYLKALIESNKLKPVIETEYSYQNIAQAHAKSATGRVVGKLVVKFE
jgi:NADPH:quinone reductase-like Zn-dependent oxidoreductase